MEATTSPKEILNYIRKEIAVFECNNQRPNSLESIYNALMTIPPTSVEAERSFSAAGLFITKLRTSLKDETIDNLCFIRSFLMQNEQKF